MQTVTKCLPHNENQIESTPTTPRKARLSEIDALRGIAALSVVLLHYTTDFHRDFHPSRYSALSWKYGAYGVHLFFLISGFVILMTAERSKSSMDFIFSRFSRLFPPYWFAVLSTTALLIAFPLQLETATPSLIRRGIVDLTMFQYWFRVGSVDSAYWTLQVEMSFYLIILFLIWRRAIDRAVFVMTFIVIAAVFDHVTVSRPLGATYSYLSGLFLLENAYLFTIGMVVYKSLTHFRWYYVAIIALALMCPVTANYFPHAPLQDALVSATLTLVLFGAAHGYARWLVIKPLIFLGGISYSLYLIHHWLGFLVLTQMDRAGLEPNFSLVVALAVTISVATAMRYWIELPCLRLLRTWYVRRQTKALAHRRESVIEPNR